MTARIDPERIPAGSKLELYISPECPYCAAAIAHYDRTGTAYTVHDAENNERLRERMLQIAGGNPTVPVIVVDGAYVQSGWGTPPRG